MKKITLVLDNIRSVFNTGSIIRTADAVGNLNIYICGITATPENPKMSKTSLGAEKNLSWKYFYNTLDAVKQLKKQKIPVYGVELNKRSKNFQDFEYFKDSNHIALVFGHEKNGISEPVLDECTELLYIPMHGNKESLNVAITASILMYEVIRYN